MINPLQELSDIYLGNISEEDNSPEAVKGRVMQYVRAIRYRARKEGETLNKAYNDFMGGQSGVSSTEKQMVKERLGLTGGSAHVGEAVTMGSNIDSDASVDKATRKAATRKFANTTPPKLKKESLSNWREDLREISDGIPVTQKKADEKITEKKVSNKITINPVQGQVESVAAELGGELLEMYEVREASGDDQQLQQLQRKQLQLDLRKLKMRRKAMATNKTADLDAEQKEKENTVTSEGVISEKQKDTPDQVKAVIAYDKARKGTDDATYDTEHGDKKQAKKERDYAKWQRDRGAELAQRSGHPWEHAKGSTREKEGKKSVKHAHIKDDKDWDQSLELHDADGNLVYEVIDVIKAPALAAIGEDLASVKATTYGLPHRERENAIKKYKEEQKKKNRKAKKAAKKDAEETVPATGPLKKFDKDGNKRVRVIDAGYEPEGESIDERLGGKGYKPYTSLTGKKVSGDWEDSDRGGGHKSIKRAGGKVEKKSPTYLAHVHNKEGFSSWRDDLVEKDLTAAERRALPDKDFALPGKGKGPQGKQAGSYPIPDEKHARSALSLVAQHGTPSEKAKVRAKVKAKFPAIFQGIKVEETDVKEKQKKAKMAAILARMQELAKKNQKKALEGDVAEDYEDKKSSEVLAAFRRDPKVRKRFEKAAKREKGPGTVKNRAADSMLQTAKDIAKRRGDTSKSDDRYAYESADPAFTKVVGNLKKEFGDTGVLASKKDFDDHKKREAAKPKPKPKPQKPLTADEKAQREVDARYGRTPWNKEGSLGT